MNLVEVLLAVCLTAWLALSLRSMWRQRGRGCAHCSKRGGCGN